MIFELAKIICKTRVCVCDSWKKRLSQKHHYTTAMNRLLPVNGTFTVADNKPITFNAIRKFITMFATACHLA